MKKITGLLTFAILALVGCKQRTMNDSETRDLSVETSSSDEAQVEKSGEVTDKDVEAVVLKLRRYLRNGMGPISDYYQNEFRVQACFTNPAAKELSGWQRTLYCHFPLEFRLCLTPLTIKNRKSNMGVIPFKKAVVTDFAICQKKLNEAFAELKQPFFSFDETVHPKTSAVFERVYVNKQDPASDSMEFLKKDGFKPSEGTFGDNFKTLVFEVLGEEGKKYKAFRSMILKGVPDALFNKESADELGKRLNELL